MEKEKATLRPQIARPTQANVYAKLLEAQKGIKRWGVEVAKVALHVSNGNFHLGIYEETTPVYNHYSESLIAVDCTKTRLKRVAKELTQEGFGV